MMAVDTITAADVLRFIEVAALIGSAWAVVKSKRLREDLNDTRASNDELRKEVADVERRRAADRVECDAQLASMRAELAAMRPEFAKAIAEPVATAVSRGVIDALTTYLDGRDKP